MNGVPRYGLDDSLIKYRDGLVFGSILESITKSDMNNWHLASFSRSPRLLPAGTKQSTGSGQRKGSSVDTLDWDPYLYLRSKQAASARSGGLAFRGAQVVAREFLHTLAARTPQVSSPLVAKHDSIVRDIQSV